MSSNSSTGQILGYVVGAVVGYFTGGTGWALFGNVLTGASVGGAVGGMLDPPKGPTLTGPRLGDLSVQSATYGAHIPRIYGTVATMGNVFWLEGDSLKETLTKKKSGGKGGGGSTVKTYSYSATFAVGLCEGPISGVRRIWVGAKLIYDAGSDDVESIIASNQAAQKFRVYLGTEDQHPDPRMQADKGVSNTPAYRGLAYIVMYDYPLKEHGNSLLGAQVKVEVVQSVAQLGYVLKLRKEIAGWPQKYYPKSVYSTDSGVAQIYGYDPFAGTSVIDGITVGNDEALLTVLQSGQYAGQAAVPADATRTRFTSSGNESHRVATVGGVDVWVQEFFTSTAIGTAGRNLIPLGEIFNKNTVNAFGSLGSLESLIPSENGKYINGMAVSSDKKRILLLTGPEAPWFTSIFDVNPNAYFLFDENLDLIESGTVTGGGIGLCEVGEFNSSAVLEPGYYNGWTSEHATTRLNVKHFQISDGVLTVSPLTPYFGFSSNINSVAIAANEAMFYALVRNTTSVELFVVSRSEVSFAGGVLLSDVVESESLSAGSIFADDIDVSAITDELRGYRVTQTGAIRAAIEPLQSAWPFDVIQSGYKIKAVPRGGTSVATIPAPLLDARAAGDAPGPQITIVREMDTQLPRRVSIKHMDIAREYDIGEQYAERGGGDSIGVREMEMPIVFNGAEAAQKAEVLLYLYWLERHTIQFKLPPEYLGLEPADVITIVVTDATYELRLTNINYLSDGRLECVARYNSAAIYTSTATGETSSVVGGVVGLDGPSKYELLDIPALRSEMDAPLFVAAMTGYTGGWPGGILYRSSDGGQSWDDLQGWTGKCTMGSARNALAAHPGSVIDAASLLQVDLIAGELESVTDLAMLNGSNHFAYGAHGRWEIIAAKNCVVQADGSYYLTDLLRGRFGTEHNTGTHVAGDAVILLNDPDLALIGMDSASIGLGRSYRGITAGRTLDSDADRSFTYSGVNLECLSPVYLNGNRHPSTNDWTLTWTRRTRISGEWRDLIDAPLSEAAEAYEIEIYTSAAYTTLKRTLTSTTPTVAYTSAQQVTDFGSNQATLYVRVYQMSATVGRGFPLQAQITR